MATPFQLGDYVQLRVWTQYAAVRQAAVNSAWYNVSAVGASPATDQDFVNQMDGVVAPVYKPLIPADVRYQGCQAYIHSTTPPYPVKSVAVHSTAGAGVGTGVASPLPTQTSGILRFQTSRPGPSGRGRWYVAFPPIGGDDGTGKPSAGYITALLTMGGEVAVGVSLLAGGRSATLVRILLHGKNKAGLYPSPTAVIDWQADAAWATQKRRGAFGRSNVSPI